MNRLKNLYACGLIALIPAIAIPCCVAYGDHQIDLVNEKVIIVWDEEKKIEHFIRQASFHGDAKDFGFIVPTPTKPEVAVADAAAFSRLEKLRPKDSGFQLGCKKGEAATDSAAGVEILEQYLVGDYQATIVKATDGKSMIAWLKTNEYKTRPAMETWLDHYAKQDWIFTALKFVRSPDQVGDETTALRLSFKTERPHYPYKMPDDTWPKDHYRPLALYFIGPDEASANYRGLDEEWEAETIWSAELPDDQVEGLAKELGLKQEDIPSGSVVTAMHNTENAQGYGRDLDFSFGWGIGFLEGTLMAGGAALLAFLVYKVFQRSRRDPMPAGI